VATAVQRSASRRVKSQPGTRHGTAVRDALPSLSC
jgi:hypothetical protein